MNKNYERLAVLVEQTEGQKADYMLGGEYHGPAAGTATLTGTGVPAWRNNPDTAAAMKVAQALRQHPGLSTEPIMNTQDSVYLSGPSHNEVAAAKALYSHPGLSADPTMHGFGEAGMQMAMAHPVMAGAVGTVIAAGTAMAMTAGWSAAKDAMKARLGRMGLGPQEIEGALAHAKSKYEEKKGGR